MRFRIARYPLKMLTDRANGIYAKLLRSRFLSSFNDVLILFYLFIVIISVVPTILALMLVGRSVLAFACGGVTKERLLGSALLAADHEIPLEWFAPSMGETLAQFCLGKRKASIAAYRSGA